MVWDYVAPVYDYLVPFPNMNVLQPNIQLFKNKGAIGVFEEGSYTSWLSDMSDLKTYILSKLLWDADSNIDELTNDFWKTCMEKPHLTLNNIWNTSALLFRKGLIY